MNNDINNQQPLQFEVTPNVTVQGATMDKIFMILNNPMVFVKGTDGAMHPFVDPNPIIALLRDSVLAQMKNREVGSEAQPMRPQ